MRPNYAKAVGKFFNLPITTKAEIQRIGNEKKAPLLAQWQATEDLAIYDHPDYVWDALQCYEKVTTPAIQGIVQHLDSVGKPRGSLIDVWNGVGLSSIQAAQAGFNVSIINNSAPQLKLAQFLEQELLGYNLPVLQLDTEQTFDVVCSFEVLEHYKEPLTHLAELVRLVKPGGILAIGTGFADKDNVGHYETYILDGKEVPNKKVPRLIDARLRDLGFTKVYSYFNGRPRIWRAH